MTAETTAPADKEEAAYEYVGKPRGAKGGARMRDRLAARSLTMKGPGRHADGGGLF